MSERKKLNKDKLVMWILVIGITAVTFFSMNVAYAAGPGSSFGKWMQNEGKGIFTGITVALGIAALVKREFGSLAKVFILCAAVSVFVWSPQIMNTVVGAWFKSMFNLG
ncbi:hypothetical protein NRS6107_21085 (plasmid) [Bacillus subtilis]|uniref:hypothetical protein n=1 Tax=Bacillus subtilis TaxID=1423 RepID=UPI001BA19E1D|nr:hypothetical protein [Bacillus subtilis]CAF1785167.1 hypothetical protein NRS6107_04076 [Bacillus subtilis]CAI6329509.1 hypothetical protein NRS6107_21085 [Bacillus subtilis]